MSFFVILSLWLRVIKFFLFPTDQIGHLGQSQGSYTRFDTELHKHCFIKSPLCAAKTEFLISNNLMILFAIKYRV